MIECEACNEWFHLPCVSLTIEKAKSIKHYKCDACLQKEEEARKERRRIEREQQERLAAEQAALLQASKPVRAPCTLEGCKGWARPGSLYCKNECGLEVTRLKLRNREIIKRLRQNAERSALYQQMRLEFVAFLQRDQPHLLLEHQIPPLHEQELESAKGLPCGLSLYQAQTYVVELKEIERIHASITASDSQIKELEEARQRLEQYITTVADLPLDSDPPVSCSCVFCP